MTKAIIFDCFGVLVAEGWKPFATKHFGEPSDTNEKRKWANARMHAVSRGELSHEALADEMTAATGVSREDFLAELRETPADQALLDYIRTELKPKYKIGFLSNVGLNRMTELFSASELELFDKVVLSFELGMAKPERGIYEHTAELLGVKPEECIFTDDTKLYVDGAEAARMSAILYTDFSDFKRQLEQMI